MSKSKRARTPRGHRGPKMPSIDELSNPVAVAALQDAAKALVADLDEGKPGMETLKAILPAALLMAVPNDVADGALELDDGTVVPVRNVDLQVAGLGMFARAMAKIGNEVLTKDVARLPMRLFNADARAAALPKAPPAPPDLAGVDGEQRQGHDDAIPSGPEPAKKPSGGR